jgi:hypothetical protein
MRFSGCISPARNFRVSPRGRSWSPGLVTSRARVYESCLRPVRPHSACARLHRGAGPDARAAHLPTSPRPTTKPPAHTSLFSRGVKVSCGCAGMPSDEHVVRGGGAPSQHDRATCRCGITPCAHHKLVYLKSLYSSSPNRTWVY